MIEEHNKGILDVNNSDNGVGFDIMFTIGESS